ncbi:MAG: M14 family zinc carboxypeptidase, partial [Oleiharenicola lentus]
MRSFRLPSPPVIFFLLATTGFAAGPQDFLPPAQPWHGASEALMAKADNPWITPAEKTGLTDSPNYDDTIAWLKKLCAATPLVKMTEFGRTAQGRALYVVIASKEGAATPAALAANGKPTLLAQAGIHSGEIDGKDA